MFNQQESVPTKCLNCKADLTSPIVCSGCHTLYAPPGSANYFEVLGVPATFDLDPVEVLATFRSVAKQIHPDRFGGAPEEARTTATSLAALVNRAFEVLQDPVRRADYLLELAGGPSAAEVREVPGNLLAQVMMLREEVEEAKAGESGPTLDLLRARVSEQRKTTLRSIAEQVRGVDNLDSDGRKELRKALNSIKYYDNLLSELAEDPLARREE